MDKSNEYDQIILDNLPGGFRITEAEAICENGMPENVRAHYEGLADLSDDDLAAKAKSGELFSVKL